MIDLNLENDFWKNCDYYVFDKQNQIIKTCVKRAIDEWIKNELSTKYPNYQIKRQDGIYSFIAYELSYYIMTDKALEAEKIAAILSGYFHKLDAADENFSLEVFSKLAMTISNYLSKDLPKNSRVTLPEHLWEMEEYNCVAANYDSEKNMRICVEHYKFDTIIEGKICNPKELKRMFKKAIKLRNNDYDGFAELFCKLYDFKIIKVIPYLGMVSEFYNFTLDIDTDLVLAREGGWDKKI